MGSHQDDDQGASDERPQHRVTIEHGFRMGRYELTFEQYCASSLRNCPSDEGWGKGARPVINISWNDATEYAGWLGGVIGQRFRLPSEAEWEYAARAGTKARYWWGDDVQQDGKVWANCGGCGSEWDNDRTAPVGCFDPNPFGLYDTAGNVWEWVQDCSIDDYDDGPNDAAAREKDKRVGCGVRVLRGGSWNDGPRGVRSAYREGSGPGTRFTFVGFRLAQDL